MLPVRRPTPGSCPNHSESSVKTFTILFGPRIELEGIDEANHKDWRLQTSQIASTICFQSDVLLRDQVMSKSLRKFRGNIYNPLRLKDKLEGIDEANHKQWRLQTSQTASMICLQTSRRPTPGSGYFRITQKSPRKLYQPKSISQPITQLALCFLSKYKALEHPILTQTIFGKGTLSYWYFIFHIEILQKITNDKFARHIEDPPNVCVTSKIFPENTHLSSLFLSHLQSTDYLLRHLTFLCRMNTRGIELDEAERNILSLFPIAPISQWLLFLQTTCSKP